MFRFQTPSFGSGGEPWFRIGTFEVNTSALFGLTTIVGMVLWAVEGMNHTLSLWLAFDSAAVLRGQIWRLATWWIPDSPSIWVLLSAAILYLLGSQLESILGRDRMAQFLGVLVLIPTVSATLLDLVGFPGTPLHFFFIAAPSLSTMVFYAFVAHMPNAKFFFGIPGWVLAAVFVVIELLQLTTERSSALIVLLFMRIGGVLLAARAFGLAEDLPWVPRIPVPGMAAPGGYGQPSRKPKKSGRFRRPKRNNLRVVEGSAGPSFDDAELDAILDQVSAFGVESLTAEQKAKLKAYRKGR